MVQTSEARTTEQQWGTSVLGCVLPLVVKGKTQGLWVGKFLQDPKHAQSNSEFKIKYKHHMLKTSREGGTNRLGIIVSKYK